MSHIEAYALVKISGDLTNFEKTVNSLLAAGWELHGPTQVKLFRYKNEDGRDAYGTIYYQAMVKLKEED